MAGNQNFRPESDIKSSLLLFFINRSLKTYSDGKKLEDICPSTHNMECPIVKRTEYQLIDIDEEGYCSLMDDSGETRDDLKPIDPDLEKEIRDKVENGEDALVCVLAVSTRDFD